MLKHHYSEAITKAEDDTLCGFVHAKYIHTMLLDLVRIHPMTTIEILSLIYYRYLPSD